MPIGLYDILSHEKDEGGLWRHQFPRVNFMSMPNNRDAFLSHLPLPSSPSRGKQFIHDSENVQCLAVLTALSILAFEFHLTNTC